MLTQNKVSLVINCSASQIGNLWSKKGIRYISFKWKDENNQVILDKGDKNINQVAEGINRSHENGESVLVHSI